MSEKVLDIKGLKVRFETDHGTVYAVDGVDLSLNSGETLGLVGETGAGKTTTALAILRLLDKSNSIVECEHMLYCGEDMNAMSEDAMRKIRGRDITMIFQDPMTALNPVIRIVDQVSEIFRAHKNMNKREAEEAALSTLEMVRIPRDRAYEYPHQFSGGMKQRVVIAMALACSPKILISDEPTTALDVTIQAQVLKLIKELQTNLNTSMIMITHDFGIVAETCDKVAVMYAGEIIESGPIRSIFKNASHPYTVGLFHAVPSLTSNREFLYQIDGLMPDPMVEHNGCPFAERCRYANDVCGSRKPEKTLLDDEHVVRCHIYTGEVPYVDVRKEVANA